MNQLADSYSNALIIIKDPYYDAPPLGTQVMYVVCPHG